MSNYDQLINKLDDFIRKYYLNQTIKGLLLSSALVLALFLIYALLEHFFYFGTGVRKLMYYSFIGVAGLSFIGWVAFPLLKLFRLGKVISHEEAARIIGKHFSEVEDKLLNILQLRKQADKNKSALVLAGIEQKTVQLKPVPFLTAIDLGENKKYARYVVPTVFVIAGLLILSPTLIPDSTNRILQNHLQFERPAPFHFKVLNDEMSVMQFENFQLEVSTEGDIRPAEAYVDIGGYEYRMRKGSDGNFTYTFNNIQSDTDFRIVSGPVKSRSYTLDVIRKPRMADMLVELEFPAYTGRNSTNLSNVGDFTVPEGTKINWTFYTESSTEVEMRFLDPEELISAEVRRPNHFEYSDQFTSTRPYVIYVSGEELHRVDSVGYTVNVIPDRYPVISVEEFIDEDDEKIRFYAGEASDDYGLREISFHYQLTKADGNEEPEQRVLVETPGSRNSEFVFNWDMIDLEMKPGDQVTYFFEAADNDAINGSKRTRTGLMTYRIKSLEEMEEIASENTESIRENLDRSVQETQDIEEEIRRMQERLLDKKDLDWQDRRDIEQLLEKREELMKQIEDSKEKHRENLQNQEEFLEMDPELMEKQKQFQELFDQMVDDDMRDLMEKLRDMLDEMSRDDALDMLREMELSEQNMKMNIDRMNELFKSLEVEQQMNRNREELEKLADQLDELSEETASGETAQEELQQKQEEIQEKFDDLKEKLKEMREKNEELARPHNLGDQEQMEDDISNQLDQGSEQLDEGDNEGASESQQEAGDKMREMAQSMQSSMQGGQMEQMQEDMATLRKLLDNLISISFDQEDLIGDFNRTSINTPRYVDLLRDQFRLQSDFRVVEDSLVALSKRVLQLESFILSKVTDINRHFDRGIHNLEERRKSQASDDQRRVMTYVNDLALMLSQTMEQMQQQMAGMMSGTQMCESMGEGEGDESEGPVDKITEGQEQLGDQMEQMQQRMQEGENGSAEDFARMARDQAKLRKMLEELRQRQAEQGIGAQELQEIIDKMNEIERDLVNKQLNRELLERQQDIISRLLQAERADREQDLDDERRGEVAQERTREFPPELEEYLRKRESEIHFYRSVAPGLSPYYQFLVDEYYRSLRSN
ncbi:MAG: DUF4175 family protein [Saprospirales bacterium]|nr:MAG: DUF4175 family protein [Saprospirales bacterium]